MDPRREDGSGPQGGNLIGARRLLLAGDVEDAQRPLHARCARTPDNRLQIVGEGGVGEMAMRVDHAPIPGG